MGVGWGGRDQQYPKMSEIQKWLSPIGAVSQIFCLFQWPLPLVQCYIFLWRDTGLNISCVWRATETWIYFTQSGSRLSSCLSCYSDHKLLLIAESKWLGQLYHCWIKRAKSCINILVQDNYTFNVNWFMLFEVTRFRAQIIVAIKRGSIYETFLLQIWFVIFQILAISQKYYHVVPKDLFRIKKKSHHSVTTSIALRLRQQWC